MALLHELVLGPSQRLRGFFRGLPTLCGIGSADAAFVVTQSLLGCCCPLQVLELEDHPFFVAVQFHPEFKSRPGRPSPLFLGMATSSPPSASRALSFWTPCCRLCSCFHQWSLRPPPLAPSTPGFSPMLPLFLLVPRYTSLGMPPSFSSSLSSWAPCSRCSPSLSWCIGAGLIKAASGQGETSAEAGLANGVHAPKRQRLATSDI